MRSIIHCIFPGAYLRFTAIILPKHARSNAFSARAGIRTRVDGMKTRNDGPGYTTRATAYPPTTR